ncbi:sugar phosphate isomerase/epimerase family protein [Portibacter marinus]|uniref:sugar phosphate isomerase/epimerase family protein n=1 Tax=Portibacter marinus TaxID=2898660 RepID=UPI001F24B39D|nr:sugar phosphate isomerase/epimerase family protein [Portibacter marinus]
MKISIILGATLIILLCAFTPWSSECVGKNSEEGFEISLAQWSLHKSFFGDLNNDWAWFGKMLRESPDSLLRGDLHPDDFPEIAAGFDVNIIELVNTFYYSKAEDMDYWQAFKEQCEEVDVRVGLIMCDALGDIGNADAAERMKAVENHYPWVDVAAFLGAESIRVNAAGSGSAQKVADNAVDGLKKLGEYAATKGVNVLVENHGGYSSNGAWLSEVMSRVGMENVGTLPDFGNFCIERGANWTCAKEYDRYKGIAELMPYAKGVSAKTNAFTEEGKEANMDYLRIMKIVKDSGFRGTIGIEYEGNELSEEEGIQKTKALLESVLEQI